jgi:uncharacterized protein YdhG (YjbR/CyaY superfamily)
MNSASTEVQAYYESLSVERREQLGALRSHIKHVWPLATEDFSFALPTYSIDGKPAFALASQKEHMVLHVIAIDLLEPFKNELRTIDHGKGCIRFRALTPELVSLLDHVIKYVGSQIQLSKRSTRPTNQKKRAAPAG